MFTQACLIRDYNKDLIYKIENIGYRNYGNPFQFTDYSILYTTIDGYYVPYKVQVDSSWIDCGTNEELFFAVAALRDDSDRLQWFVHQDGSFLKCECDSKIDMWGDFEYPEIYPRKATVSELIEHFNK